MPAAITKQRIEKAAGDSDHFWVEFWRAAKVAGSHWLWPTRPAVRVGRGTRAVTVQARLVAWLYDGQAPVSELVPTCGNARCIRPAHQRIGAR